MDSRWLWAVLVLIIVILGGWYLLSRPTPTVAPTTTTTNQAATTSADTPNPTPGPATTTPAPVTVTYTDQGFSPKAVTVTEGQTVTWVNKSSHPMWVASAPHPAHTGYDGTNRTTHCATGYAGAKPFDECAPGATGATYSFTFDKAGTWPYHDHMNASLFGSVTVTAAPTNAGIESGVTASTTVNVH